MWVELIRCLPTDGPQRPAVALGLAALSPPSLGGAGGVRLLAGPLCAENPLRYPPWDCPPGTTGSISYNTVIYSYLLGWLEFGSSHQASAIDLIRAVLLFMVRILALACVSPPIFVGNPPGYACHYASPLSVLFCLVSESSGVVALYTRSIRFRVFVC